MDDLGNIIYILIGIGWFFWNAYKKSQAKKEKPSPKRRARSPKAPEQADPEYKTLEDLIFGREEEKEVVVEPVVTPTVTYKNEDKFLNIDRDHSHLPDDYQMSVSESGSHRVQRQVQKTFKEEMGPEINVREELFPEGFDLRRAVVLSAILDRPYR